MGHGFQKSVYPRSLLVTYDKARNFEYGTSEWGINKGVSGRHNKWTTLQYYGSTSP